MARMLCCLLLVVSTTMMGCVGQVVFETHNPHAHALNSARANGYEKMFRTFVNGEPVIAVLVFDIGRTQRVAQQSALSKGESILSPNSIGFSSRVRVLSKRTSMRQDGLWKAEYLMAVPLRETTQSGWG